MGFVLFCLFVWFIWLSGVNWMCERRLRKFGAVGVEVEALRGRVELVRRASLESLQGELEHEVRKV